jgi:acetolactate synthase I/II/III large subunit
MQWLKRPLITLGHGIRAAGCADLAPMLLNLGLPVVASWQGKDLVDNSHPNFLGCTGVYGNRAANKAFATADQIVSVGNRLCLWNVAEQGLAHNPQVDKVDDISYWIRQVAEPADCSKWLAQCHSWKSTWLEPCHADANGYINSYAFTKALEPYLAPDEVIVTDMGAPLMSAHQVLCLKPPQRLMTSGGLGEMGCGLPAAIGACFAGAKRVLCLEADGSMMLNLQELQTIIHHKLPIKIIVYDNKGYLMLKHTQRTQGFLPSGVDAESGVSFPDYKRLAQDFGFFSENLRTWDDFHYLIPPVLEALSPSLLVYHMDPTQPLVPRLYPTSPSFDQMSPPQ